MHRSLALLALLAAAVAALAVGCGDDGSPRRVIEVIQGDDSCNPVATTAEAGERLSFRIKNESGKDYEFEGIDGTRIEELLVPAGRTRTVNYDVPSTGDVQKIKCYVPAGPSTIIEISVSGASGGGETPSTEDEAEAAGADVTVAVTLDDYVITADPAVVEAGAVRFHAQNVNATSIHELAVLREKSDGSYENLGEIEDITPLTDGTVVIDLPKGSYLLACLIAPGEAGSTVDHFAKGMKLEFSVE